MSLQSDFSSAGQIVNTDMTTLQEEDETSVEEDPSIPMVARSVSVVSRGSQGPGWRANMKGDYDPTNIKPIANFILHSTVWVFMVSLHHQSVRHGIIL